MNSKRFSSICAVLAALGAGSVTSSALASSHAEAPGTASDPDTDNTDVWAWRKGNNLVVIANYNGLQPAYAAPNWKKFADDALYEVHVARGPDSLDDAVTYQIQFKTARYPRVDVADLNAPVGGGKEFFAQISGGGAFAQTYSVTKIVNRSVHRAGERRQGGPAERRPAYELDRLQDPRRHDVRAVLRRQPGNQRDQEPRQRRRPSIRRTARRSVLRRPRRGIRSRRSCAP